MAVFVRKHRFLPSPDCRFLFFLPGYTGNTFHTRADVVELFPDPALLGLLQQLPSPHSLQETESFCSEQRGSGRLSPREMPWCSRGAPGFATHTEANSAPGPLVKAPRSTLVICRACAPGVLQGFPRAESPARLPGSCCATGAGQ